MAVKTWTGITISTGHLPEGDFARLDEASERKSTEGPLCAWEHYGWLVWLPLGDDRELCEEHIQGSWIDFGMSRAFISLMRELARRHGCLWVNFDCDGLCVDGLPVYHHGSYTSWQAKHGGPRHVHAIYPRRGARTGNGPDCNSAAGVDLGGSNPPPSTKFVTEPDQDAFLEHGCESCADRRFILSENDRHGLRIERCDACAHDRWYDEEAVTYAYELACELLGKPDRMPEDGRKALGMDLPPDKRKQ